jgi:exodeoxyribonuclease VII small subunit
MAKKKTKEPTGNEPSSYENAWAELQKILAEMQSGAVGVDELAERIERMSTLIQFCRARLRNTEDAISRLSSE